MYSSGFNFYRQNADVFASKNKDVVFNTTLEMQASIVYKSQFSTKITVKTLERTTRHLSREHRLLKDLAGQHQLEIKILGLTETQPSRTSDEIDLSSVLEHANAAGTFFLAVFDLRRVLDEKAVNILSAYEKVYAEQTSEMSNTVLGRTTRVSKPTLKRKAAEELALESTNTGHKNPEELQSLTAEPSKDSARQAIHRIRLDCPDINKSCRYINKSAEEHSAIHMLHLNAVATNAKERVLGRGYSPNELASHRRYLEMATFFSWPEPVQRTWISLRQNAVRFGCDTPPSPAFALSTLTERGNTHTAPEHPLPLPKLLAIRRKFICREIDITAGGKLDDDEKGCRWENSPVIAIWAGPVLDDSVNGSIVGSNAFLAAKKLKKLRAEMVAYIRALDAARNAPAPLTTDEAAIEERQMLTPPKTPENAPPSENGEEKVEVVTMTNLFEDTPLSALPYRMRSVSSRSGICCMGELSDYKNKIMMDGKKELELKKGTNLRFCLLGDDLDLEM